MSAADRGLQLLVKLYEQNGELPTIKEARQELRAAGLDPDEVGRRLRRRIESASAGLEWYDSDECRFCFGLRGEHEESCMTNWAYKLGYGGDTMSTKENDGEGRGETGCRDEKLSAVHEILVEAASNPYENDSDRFRRITELAGFVLSLLGETPDPSKETVGSATAKEEELLFEKLEAALWDIKKRSPPGQVKALASDSARFVARLRAIRETDGAGVDLCCHLVDGSHQCLRPAAWTVVPRCGDDHGDRYTEACDAHLPKMVAPEGSVVTPIVVGPDLPGPAGFDEVEKES